MSKEKQIEEIEELTIDMCICCRGNITECSDESPCEGVCKHAKALYNMGYHKQSEGEWIWTESGEEDYEQYWVCSNCKEHDFFQSKFCPDCGAKMKGGE